MRYQRGATRQRLIGALSGSLHIAVVSDYSAGLGDFESVELAPLMDDPLLVAVAANHPLAERRRRRLAVPG